MENIQVPTQEVYIGTLLDENEERSANFVQNQVHTFRVEPPAGKQEFILDWAAPNNFRILVAYASCINDVYQNKYTEATCKKCNPSLISANLMNYTARYMFINVFCHCSTSDHWIPKAKNHKLVFLVFEAVVPDGPALRAVYGPMKFHTRKTETNHMKKTQGTFPMQDQEEATTNVTYYTETTSINVNNNTETITNTKYNTEITTNSETGNFQPFLQIHTTQEGTQDDILYSGADSDIEYVASEGSEDLGFSKYTVCLPSNSTKRRLTEISIQSMTDNKMFCVADKDSDAMKFLREHKQEFCVRYSVTQPEGFSVLYHSKKQKIKIAKQDDCYQVQTNMNPPTFCEHKHDDILDLLNEHKLCSQDVIQQIRQKRKKLE